MQVTKCGSWSTFLDRIGEQAAGYLVTLRLPEELVERL
jgi:hypothetical protein